MNHRTEFQSNNVDLQNIVNYAGTKIYEQTDLIKRIKIELGLMRIAMAPVELTKSNVGPSRTVHFANGIWVVGFDWSMGLSFGGLYYSTDGMSWTKSNITTVGIADIYNANGLWVACSNDNSGLYYSTDGMTWTQSNVKNISFAYIYNANGLWVACSNKNSNSGLFYSTDGMTWSQSNVISGAYNTVYFANGIWVAGGDDNLGCLCYSTDGMTWTQSNITGENILDIYNANGIWVVCGGARNTYYSKGTPIEIKSA